MANCTSVINIGRLREAGRPFLPLMLGVLLATSPRPPALPETRPEVSERGRTCSTFWGGGESEGLVGGSKKGDL